MILLSVLLISSVTIAVTAFHQLRSRPPREVPIPSHVEALNQIRFKSNRPISNLAKPKSVTILVRSHDPYTILDLGGLRLAEVGSLSGITTRQNGTIAVRKGGSRASCQIEEVFEYHFDGEVGTGRFCTTTFTIKRGILEIGEHWFRVTEGALILVDRSGKVLHVGEVDYGW